MFANNYGLFQSRSSNDVKDFVENLISDHPDFQPLFEQGIDVINDEQINQLTRKFDELYPHENLTNVIEKYKSLVAIVPKPCNVNVYDPQSKKFYNPNITTSIKKTKCDFNLAEFLMNEQEEHRCINLNFDTNDDEYYNLQDLPFDEKKKNNAAAENSLNQIAKFALILNNTKELPFQLLAVRGEEQLK